MRVASAAILLFATPALAQQTSPTIKALVGTWELSNADRDRICAVSLKADARAGGYALELDRRCRDLFPAIRDSVVWSLGARDILLLSDANGQTVLEMIEVEAGTYEGLRPNEGRYILQNAAVAAASRDRTPDEMFGDWSFARGGKPICAVTLANVAVDSDHFALRVKPGCDQLVVRFAPASWTLERGQLVVRSRRGEAWRFEEGDPTTWRRIPESRQPLLLLRQ